MQRMRKESSRETLKLNLLSHLHTPGQSLGEVGENVGIVEHIPPKSDIRKLWGGGVSNLVQPPDKHFG